MNQPLLEGEFDWLSSVVDDLTDDDLKLVYADWLEERGDERADFLRRFVQASRTMKRSDFPPVEQFDPEWVELLGYRILATLAEEDLPGLKSPLLKLARPALRLRKIETPEDQIPVGASKYGGLPHLSAQTRWPAAGECDDWIYPTTSEELTGFIAQINLSEIAQTQAMRDLPHTGLLSFFSFQDCENDDPDLVAIKVLFEPRPNELQRKDPPKRLTFGNEIIPPCRLRFEEMLDLPSPTSGPWSEELKPYWKEDYIWAIESFYEEPNLEHFLGYGRSTSGDDPTPSKEFRHLILLNRPGGCGTLQPGDPSKEFRHPILRNKPGCCQQIQIHQADLSALRFEAINLAWVDVD